MISKETQFRQFRKSTLANITRHFRRKNMEKKLHQDIRSESSHEREENSLAVYEKTFQKRSFSIFGTFRETTFSSHGVSCEPVTPPRRNQKQDIFEVDKPWSVKTSSKSEIIEVLSMKGVFQEFVDRVCLQEHGLFGLWQTRDIQFIVFEHLIVVYLLNTKSQTQFFFISRSSIVYQILSPMFIVNCWKSILKRRSKTVQLS